MNRTDARLVDLCGQVIELRASITALWAGIRHVEFPESSTAELATQAKVRVIDDTIDCLLLQIAAAPAVTWSGIRAKTRLLQTWESDSLIKGIEDERQGRLLLGLLHDIAAIPLCSAADKAA